MKIDKIIKQSFLFSILIIESYLNVISGLFEECLDIDGLVTEVSDSLHSSSVLFPQVLKVLVGSFVVGIVHLDGAGIDQLWCEALDL